MGTRQIVQEILDDALLSRGILSNHLRRIDATVATTKDGAEVKIDPSIYVVYRIVSTQNGFGDGQPITAKPYVDVNVYYDFEKHAKRVVTKVESALRDIKAAFIKNHFRSTFSGFTNTVFISILYLSLFTLIFAFFHYHLTKL